MSESVDTTARGSTNHDAEQQTDEDGGEVPPPLSADEQRRIATDLGIDEGVWLGHSTSYHLHTEGRALCGTIQDTTPITIPTASIDDLIESELTLCKDCARGNISAADARQDIVEMLDLDDLDDRQRFRAKHVREIREALVDLGLGDDAASDDS
jgi:hypothetical protein